LIEVIRNLLRALCQHESSSPDFVAED